MSNFALLGTTHSAFIFVIIAYFINKTAAALIKNNERHPQELVKTPPKTGAMDKPT